MDYEFPFAPKVAEAVRNFVLKPWHPHRLKFTTEPLPDRLNRLRILFAKTKLGNSESIGGAVTRLTIYLNHKYLAPAYFQEAIRQFVIGLIHQNAQYFEFPDITLKSLTSEESGEFIDFLDELETRIEHEDQIREHFFTVAAEIVINYLRILPSSSSQFFVPFHSLSPTLLTDTILLILQETDSIRALALHHTAKQIFENILTTSQLTLDQYRKTPHKVILPQQYEGDVISAYLADTPLADFLETPVSYEIPRPFFGEHCVVLAPSGHGKTQLLQALILGFLQQDPPGMFIIDSQGSMLANIERLALFNTTLKDRLLIIDPDDNPSLNFFKMGNARAGYDSNLNELFSYLFSAIDSDLTTKQGTAVAFILRLISAIPDATIATLLDLMEEQSKGQKYAPFIQQLDPTTQNFFRNQFYTKSMDGTRQQVARRLYSLLADPLFHSMFSAQNNCFDAFKCFQEKKIVLINTSQRRLGAESSSVFGRFFIAQCLAGAYQRADLPENQRPLALLIVDEAAEYFDAKTERILSQARKFGLGGIWATQFLEQMPASVKAAIFGNTAIKLSGPISYSDANALSREMYTTGDFIRSCRKTDKETEFACFVRNYTPAALKFTIPFGLMEKAPRMTHEEHKALRAANRLKVKTHERPPEGGPASQDKSDTHCIPQTHDAPTEAEAPRGNRILSAEADSPTVPPPPQKPKVWKKSEV